MAEAGSPQTCEAKPIHTHCAVWIALIVIISVTSIIRIRLLDVPLERDEGEYAYAGQLILQKIWPYRPPSLYKYKMPLIYFIYAAILGIFGQTHTAVHAGLLITNIATIILLFFLTKRLFGPFASITAAAAFSILSMSPSVLGFFAHAEHFVLLAAIAGIWLLLQAITSCRWWKLFISGLLLGSGYLIRQHGAAFMLFAAIYFLLHLLKHFKNSPSKIIFRFSVFFAGMVLPIVLTFAAVFAAGRMEKFWFWTFTYAAQTMKMTPLSTGMEFFTKNMGSIITSSILLCLLGAYGFFAVLIQSKTKAQRLFVLLFVLFSFISTCPGLRFREHYFVLLLPAIALLAGAGAESVRILCLRLRPAVAGKTLPILIVFAAIVQAVYHHRNSFFVNDPIYESRLTYGVNPFPESLEIANYIRRNSSKNDTVAILGSEPQILFYAQRHSATGYLDTYEIMKKHDYVLQMQKEMIDEIESGRPEFLIFVNISTSWLPEPESQKLIFYWLGEYVQKYYKPVGLIEITPSSPAVYRWDQDVAGYEPQSRYRIHVFKRDNSL